MAAALAVVEVVGRLIYSVAAAAVIAVPLATGSEGLEVPAVEVSSDQSHSDLIMAVSSALDECFLLGLNGFRRLWEISELEVAIFRVSISISFFWPAPRGGGVGIGAGSGIGTFLRGTFKALGTYCLSQQDLSRLDLPPARIRLRRGHVFHYDKLWRKAYKKQ